MSTAVRAIGLYLWHCKRNAITESTANRTEIWTRHRAPYVVYTTTHVLPSDLVASALERQQVSFSECRTGLIELVIFQGNRPVFYNTRISKEKEKNRENSYASIVTPPPTYIFQQSFCLRMSFIIVINARCLLIQNFR